jgi:hypothetical protein
MHPRGDIYATRVSAAGVLLDPAGIVVANTTLPEETPTVVSSGGVTLFAYSSFVQAAPYANMRLTLRAAGVPAAPQSVTAVAQATFQIGVSWADLDNESGYKVERSPNGKTGWAQVGTTAVNVTSWIDTGLTPATSYFYRVRGTNEFGDGVYSSVVQAATLAAPPMRIARVTIDDGSVQRSVVRSLSVTFNGVATIGSGAFELIRTGGAAVTLNVAIQLVNGQTVATLTFANGTDPGSGSLSDGGYTLTVRGDRITDSAGYALDGDGNGIVGGNSTTAFHRYYGDINGDRRVDIADFGMFSTTFGLHTGQPGFNVACDFNGDGVIDIADFGQFSIRFFMTLP